MRVMPHTCSSTFRRSIGAVSVRDTTPATAPATKILSGVSARSPALPTPARPAVEACRPPTPGAHPSSPQHTAKAVSGHPDGSEGER